MEIRLTVYLEGVAATEDARYDSSPSLVWARASVPNLITFLERLHYPLAPLHEGGTYH